MREKVCIDGMHCRIIVKTMTNTAKIMAVKTNVKRQGRKPRQNPYSKMLSKKSDNTTIKTKSRY
jgi:hypothetical protein